MNEPNTAERPSRPLGGYWKQAFCEIELHALLSGHPHDEVKNPDGSFQLFRVGDTEPAATSTP